MHLHILSRHKSGSCICGYSQRKISTSSFLWNRRSPSAVPAVTTSYLSRGVFLQHDNRPPHSTRHNTITDPRVVAIRISGSSTLFLGGDEVTLRMSPIPQGRSENCCSWTDAKAGVRFVLRQSFSTRAKIGGEKNASIWSGITYKNSYTLLAKVSFI